MLPRRRFVTAMVITVLVGSVTLALADVSLAAAPVVSVSPSSGNQSTTFNGSGSGFTPNSTARLQFWYPSGASAWDDPSKAINSSGGFSFTWFWETGDQFGRYRVRATDNATGLRSSFKYFTISETVSVNPVVSVSPSSGNQSTTFNGSGSGFTPNSTARLQFWYPSGASAWDDPSKAINSSGGFSFTWFWETGDQFGRYRVRATDNTTGVRSPNQYFTITETTSVNPVVSVSPSSGTIGTTFSEPGRGFTLNSGVTLWFVDPSGDRTSISKTTNSSGAYSHSYTVHGGTEVGEWRYYAVDNATGQRSNTVRFTVDASAPSVNPVVSVSPSSGDQNTTFNGSGSGFTPNSTARLQFWYPSGASAWDDPSKAINSSGGFSFTWFWESGQEFGRYRVRATDNTTGLRSSSKYFTISETVSVRLVALGDSYASGEGAGFVGGSWSADRYLPGTATAGNRCHRASSAYGPLIAMAMGVNDTDFKFVACSGAKMPDVSEWSRQHGERPQWRELDDFDRIAPVDVVLIGIGGNDAEFLRVLTRCFVLPWCHLHRSAAPTENSINELFGDLKDTYEMVKVTARSAEVYAFGYPQFFDAKNWCRATTGFSDGERAWMRDRVTQLNDVIKLAARAAGVHYVDIEPVLEDLDGLICDPSPMIHGLIRKPGEGLVWSESFHPKPEAHVAFAVEFFRQHPNVGQQGNPDSEEVTAPAVSGPTLKWGNMTMTIDSPIFLRGNVFGATAGGFDPGSLVTVGTYSEHKFFGTFTADRTGTVTFDYTVPDSLDNGQHTIEAVGSDPAGNLVVATTSILVMDAGGTFTDDNGNIHESAIEGIAFVGITRGCNPPLNDRYCPDASVTRGQMAAFLVRALWLTDDGGGNSFVDDDGSVFEADIAKLAAAGITRGCSNDRYCPDAPVTRAQMATFLVRALNLDSITPPG